MTLPSNFVMDIKPDPNQLNQINLIQQTNLAKPLHIQQIEKALNVSGFLKQVYSFIDDKNLSNGRDDLHVVPMKRQQIRTVKSMIYNVPNIKNKNKKWLKNVLLEKSDSESSDIDGEDVKSDEIRDLLKFQCLKRKLNANQVDCSPVYDSFFNHFDHQDILASKPTDLIATRLEPETETVQKTKPFSRNVLLKQKLEKKCQPLNKTLNCSAMDSEIFITPLKTENDLLDACQSFEQQEIPSLPALSQIHQSIGEMETSIPPPTTTSTDQIKTEKLSSEFASESPMLDNLKLKLEHKMLDDITYDPTLPDEILQGESNMIEDNPRFIGCTNIADEIVYSNQLPDEIFDTEEEDEAEVVVQEEYFSSLPPISNQNVAFDPQPAPVEELKIEIIQSLPIADPTQKSPSSPREQPCLPPLSPKVDQRSASPKLEQQQHPLSPKVEQLLPSPTSDPPQLSPKMIEQQRPISPKDEPQERSKEKKEKHSSFSSSSNKTEKKSIEALNAKRRRLWVTIARKEIPKAHKQKLTIRKEMLNSCKKLANMCYKERKSVLNVAKSKDNRPKKISKENTILYLKPVSRIFTIARNEQNSIQKEDDQSIGKFDSKSIKELRFEIKPETLNGLNATKLTASVEALSKNVGQQEVEGQKLAETVILLSTQKNVSTNGENSNTISG